jgi:phosphatidylserine/phosphatidylglycerophosphate/cardiolipin synthase-like enzyme
LVFCGAFIQAVEKGVEVSVAANRDQDHSRDAALIALAQARDQFAVGGEYLASVDERALAGREDAKAAPSNPVPLAVTARPGSTRGSLPAWGLIGLIALVALGATVFAWRSIHGQADPVRISTSSALKKSAMSGVSEAEEADTGTRQTSAQAQTTGPRAAPAVSAAAPPVADLAQSMAAVAHQLAEAERVIDALKTRQAQLIRENAELDEHLKATQEIARHNADVVDDIKSVQAQMALDNANLAERLKAGQGQVTNMAAQLGASQEQMARMAAQIKTSQEQIARLVEQKQRLRPLASASFPATNQPRKPATAPPSQQTSPQPQSSARLQPRQQ